MTNRIDIIGQNGNDGLVYDAAPKALGGALVSRHVADGYHGLFDVLADALDQAQLGKGAERHGQDKAFEEQPMQKLIELHGRGFAYGQAGKKAQESERLAYEAARRELLGAIVYLAGAVINLDKENRNG
jgi:hypothetical protein